MDPSAFPPLPRLLACILVVAAGCQHAPPPTGGSSFRFVQPDAANGDVKPAKKVAEGDTRVTYVDATPHQPLAVPVYPPDALEAHAGLSLVGVRIVVGSDGSVSRVEPSLVCFSTVGPFAAQFRSAVDAAVARWKFTPAEIIDLERVHMPSPQGGPDNTYWRLADRRKTDTCFDVAFTFAPSGSVLLQPTPRK